MDRNVPAHLRLVGAPEPVSQGGPRFLWRVRRACGWIIHRLRAPGCIRPVTIEDDVTGQRIRVSVDSTFVVINANGRDFYFRRLSGRFDGTGMGCG